MFSQLKILNCLQGSNEWFMARLGVPTASRFNKIITTKGVASKQRRSFMQELLEEHFYQMPKNNIQTDDMRRGVFLESQARDYYQNITNNDVHEVGGVWYPGDVKILASPDGLMPSLSKGLEIKCPNVDNHREYVLRNKLPTKYILQVQGCLWITGYQTWDFVSYCPQYLKKPMFLLTVERDESLIKLMSEAIYNFAKELEKARYELSSFLDMDL